MLIAVNIFCQKSLDMIVFSEIRPGDLIKVLVVVDDVEDELYANVEENREDYLIVKYYSESSLVYKNASVYLLEDEESLLREDSLLEHHEFGGSLFSHVKDNMYVLLEEVDMQDDNSEIYDESEDEGSDLESFIVSDTDIDGDMSLPPDHALIDRAWNEWEPSSPGSRRYKEMVERIEERAKFQMDEINF